MNNKTNGYGLLRAEEITHATRIVELSTIETRIASLEGRGLPREVAEGAAGSKGLGELTVDRPTLWKPTDRTNQRTKEIGYAIRCIETYLEAPELLVDLRLAREGYRQGHLGEYVDTTLEPTGRAIAGTVRRNRGKMTPEQRNKARIEELEQDKRRLAYDKNRLPVEGGEIRKHVSINPHKALGVGQHLKTVNVAPIPRQPTKRKPRR